MNFKKLFGKSENYTPAETSKFSALFTKDQKKIIEEKGINPVNAPGQVKESPSCAEKNKTGAREFLKKAASYLFLAEDMHIRKLQTYCYAAAGVALQACILSIPFSLAASIISKEAAGAVLHAGYLSIVGAAYMFYAAMFGKLFDFIHNKVDSIIDAMRPSGKSKA